MKKILFVAIATILLATSCQKTEIFNRTSDAMTFSSEMGKLTKADNGGLDSLKKYGFKVWAYRNFEDQYFSCNEKDQSGNAAHSNCTGMNHIYDGMNGIPVTYDETREIWDTELDYYWPGSGKHLKFYAVSSNQEMFNLENKVTIALEGDNAETITVTDFEVKTEADNDLMIADPVNQAQGQGVDNNPNAVQLNFHHTLTKVLFNFRTESSTIGEHPVYIQKIETSELEYKGDVTYPVASTAKLWSPKGEKKSFTDNNKTKINISGNITDEVIPNGGTADRDGLTLTAQFQPLDTLLVLPQDISSSNVTITYIIGTRQFTRTIPLSVGDLTEWNPNQFVKYNIVVAPNLISFSPTVGDWNEVDVNVNDSGTTVTGYKIYSVTQGETTVSVTIYQAGATPAVGETAYPDGEYAITGGTVKIAGGKVTEFNATTSGEGTGEGSQTPGQGA